MLDETRREFAAIARWQKLLPYLGDDVRVSIGDDCAVIEVGGEPLAITTDCLVEGVHFLLTQHSLADIAHKLVAINLSDLASMGAVPKWGLVTVAAPSKDQAELDEFFTALGEAASLHKFVIVGGDTSASRADLMVSLTAIGACPHPPMLRSEARVGDLICVTGALGGSAAGRAALGLSSGLDNAAKRAALRHLRPVPRLAEGQMLAQCGVKCCIDVSDGLLGDLRQILAASNVGAEVDLDKVPIDPVTKFLNHSHTPTPHHSHTPLGWALAGGEDYELLFTCPQTVLSKVQLDWNYDFAPISVIGRIVAQPNLRLLGPGAESYADLGGFDHFGE